MQTRFFGKTGKRVSILGLGCQRIVDTHNCTEDEAIEIIHTALDHGVNYFDTAWIYSKGQSESRLGQVVKNRRSEMWIASKTMEPNPQEARRQLENSLMRLQTDYIDEWRLHNVWDITRLDAFTKGRETLLATIIKAQDEGLVKYISISCHTNPQVLVEAVKRFPFDSALFPVSVLDHFVLSFVEEFLPLANHLQIATIGMKVFGRGTFVHDIERALRYALSLPLSTVIVGVESMRQLMQNLTIAESFIPMKDEERLQFFKDTVHLVQPKQVSWKADDKSNPSKWLPRDKGFWTN